MQSTIVRPEERTAADVPFIMERFLRNRAGVWQQIHADERLDVLISQMVQSSAVALACYGAVLGLSQNVFQALASAVKLPVLFLLTLAICLPTLYVCNLLSGGGLSARQLLALLLTGITATSIFTLAFTPITLFFLVTTPNYHFFILLNVAILALTGAVGLGCITAGTRYLNALAAAEQAALRDDRVECAQDPEAAEPPAVVERAAYQIHPTLLSAWLLLYGFVGAQLGWTLRPFFGIPAAPFALFRPLEGSFVESVLTMIGVLR